MAELLRVDGLCKEFLVDLKRKTERNDRNKGTEEKKKTGVMYRCKRRYITPVFYNNATDFSRKRNV